MGPSQSSRAQGRLHKRGTSASTIASPTALSPLPDSEAFLFKRSPTPRLTDEVPWNAPARPQPTLAPSNHSNKTKLYLRKFSSGRDSHSLDLSRPAAENEGLAGLGITDYSPSVTTRARHTRSTSTNSQFSTSSSLRPPAAYMPPILPTPSSYTPPITRSTPPSVLEREPELDAIMPEDEFRLWQNTYDPARRSASISSSAPGVAPPLKIHTPSSSARLADSLSRSSTSLVSPIAQARARGETLKSLDTATSPSSRTSFDKAFTFIRGGRDSPIDPASRAASIRAARIAFQQKEEAKERKHDKEVSKLAERQNHKLYKKEERQRRKSEHMDRPYHSASASDSNNEKSTPRPSIGGRQYSDSYQPHSETTRPVFVPAVRDSEKRGLRRPKVTGTRAAKSRWIRFITWFKTRILRMSNRVHIRS